MFKHSQAVEETSARMHEEKGRTAHFIGRPMSCHTGATETKEAYVGGILLGPFKGSAESFVGTLVSRSRSRESMHNLFFSSYK